MYLNFELIFVAADKTCKTEGTADEPSCSIFGTPTNVLQGQTP